MRLQPRQMERHGQRPVAARRGRAGSGAVGKAYRCTSGTPRTAAQALNLTGTRCAARCIPHPSTTPCLCCARADRMPASQSRPLPCAPVCLSLLQLHLQPALRRHRLRHQGGCWGDLLGCVSSGYCSVSLGCWALPCLWVLVLGLTRCLQISPAHMPSPALAPTCPACPAAGAV